MASYMISLRKTDGGDQLGAPRFLKLKDSTSAEVTMDPDAWRKEIIRQFPKSGTPPDTTRAGDIIFFVHGFNVDFASACAAHFSMQAWLTKSGFKGQFISYDWPSAGIVFAYLPDRSRARAAASALISNGIAMLRDAQTAGCTINLHVMAHSMGAFVTQQAFTQAYQDVPSDWRVGQLIFVAADVDASVFSTDTPTAKAFGDHAGRVTAYCDRYDKALAASNAKRLGLAPRMGRVGLPNDAPGTMCEVDCSALFDKAYPDLGSHLSPAETHCFYFDQPEFWQDVVLTLAGGIERSQMPTRENLLMANRFNLETTPLTDAAYATALWKATQSPSFIPPT